MPPPGYDLSFPHMSAAPSDSMSPTPLPAPLPLHPYLPSQLLLHAGADLMCACVQPHDGVIQGPPRLAVPYHSRLALVGDA